MMNTIYAVVMLFGAFANVYCAIRAAEILHRREATLAVAVALGMTGMALHLLSKGLEVLL